MAHQSGRHWETPTTAKGTTDWDAIARQKAARTGQNPNDLRAAWQQRYQHAKETGLNLTAVEKAEKQKQKQKQKQPPQHDAAAHEHRRHTLTQRLKRIIRGDIEAPQPSSCFASLEWSDGVAYASFHRGGAIDYQYQMSRKEFLEWIGDGTVKGIGTSSLGEEFNDWVRE